MGLLWGRDVGLGCGKRDVELEFVAGMWGWDVLQGFGAFMG